MEMMKRIMTVLLVVLLATGLMGCTKETETVRFGTMPTYTAAIYAVGVEKGFFDEAGVPVELTVFRSARDRDAAATAGELDGFMTDIMGAVNLNQKGFPFLMTSREYDDFAIMASPSYDSSAVEIPKLGLSENTVTEFIVDTYLDDEVEKVSILAVPDRMGALFGGKLDYGVFPQPFMGIIIGNGGEIVLNTASLDFHPVVVVFEEAFIEKNEASVKAFYEGYVKTVEYMQSNELSEYKDVLVKYGLATEDTVDLYRIPTDKYGLNAVAEKDYDQIIIWMKDKGLLEKEMPFETVSDQGFHQ